jgi:hypothetical protein
MLKGIYPEYPWVVWKFCSTPKGYWDSVANQRLWFKSVENELNIQKPEDWYNFSYTDLVQKYGSMGPLYLSSYNNGSYKIDERINPCSNRLNLFILKPIGCRGNLTWRQETFGKIKQIKEALWTN